ncbi:MAG: uroporphyrinogen-III synthase, partial [Nitrospirales bacterium]
MTQSGFSGLRVAAFESRMAEEMGNLIRRYGGEPLVAPALREIPLEDMTEVLQCGQMLLDGRFHLLILLTGVGTRTMLQVWHTRHAPESIKAALTRTPLVVRGPKPLAVIKALGLTPEISVPEPNTWRDLLGALDARAVNDPAHSLRDQCIGVQEYGVSNPDLLQGLRDRGAQVIPIPVYRWALPEDTGTLRYTLNEVVQGRVDVVLFTNAAQVDHLLVVLRQDPRPDCTVERFREVLQRMVVASIGPTASERLHSHSLPVD